MKGSVQGLRGVGFRVKELMRPVWDVGLSAEYHACKVPNREFVMKKSCVVTYSDLGTIWGF